jgi:hypothetical protein
MMGLLLGYKINSACFKKVDPAMKTPKSVADTTVEAFEDVRATFLSRPKG